MFLALLVDHLYSNVITGKHKFYKFLDRKPGLTGRGLYELKPECTKNFNLYFYHFSRAEQSKVINFKLLFFSFLFNFFPFFHKCFLCEEILATATFKKLNHLRLLTEFVSGFAVISLSLDALSYTELLKSVGLQEFYLWVPLCLVRLKVL